MKKNNYCTIYLMRHGQSHGNHPIDTYGLDKELTEKGHEQARSAAQKLKNVKFDAIFASPLIRAQQTAKIIAEEHKLAVLTKKALKERHHGVLEGHVVDDLKDELKKYYEMRVNLPYEKFKKVVIAEGRETDEAVMSRFITTLREIAIAYTGKSVLVIGHVSIMKTFLVHLGIITYKDLSGKKFDNTGYIKLETDGIDFFVKELSGIDIELKNE